MTDTLIVREVPWRDPATAFAPFAGEPVAALLHSAAHHATGRWSYMTVSPFSVITADEDLRVSVDGQPVEGCPFDAVAEHIAHYPLTMNESAVPFTGGAVGFFGYELAQSVERLPPPKLGLGGPALSVGLYDVLAAFDHDTGRAFVVANGFPERTVQARQRRARDRADWLSERLGDAPTPPPERATVPWHPEIPRADYEDKVARIVEYIRAGDIFQANMTQRFLATRPNGLSSWDMYKSLIAASPAPFAAYVSGGQDFQILSASPERFLSVNGRGCVETRPIKGTRKRGENADDDKEQASALTASAKDKAENLMIVDLLRNDLSRVCRPGSVHVPTLYGLETFANVHHLVSVVAGELNPDRTSLDLLRAAFPGGSVTGAPKVRAMEVIHELEPAARGPYCGAVVRIGFDGSLDSSIVIRSLIVNGDRVTAQAGGGIVADSDPAAEYEESLTKAAPLLGVLGGEIA